MVQPVFWNLRWPNSRLASHDILVFLPHEHWGEYLCYEPKGCLETNSRPALFQLNWKGGSVGVRPSSGQCVKKKNIFDLSHFTQRKITLNQHLALPWHVVNWKREKYSFPSPTPSLQVLSQFVPPVHNNKHPTFEWRGGVWIVLFSEGTPVPNCSNWHEFLQVFFFLHMCIEWTLSVLKVDTKGPMVSYLIQITMNTHFPKSSKV